MTTHGTIMVNDRWPLVLPVHRARLTSWPHWEKERLAAMYTAIRPGDLVIDVGAERGDFPALWTTWGASVAMIEPNPAVWPNIKQVWDLNGLDSPVASFVGFAGEVDDPSRADWPGECSVVNGWTRCVKGDVFEEGGFLHLDERPDCPIITLDSFADTVSYFGTHAVGAKPVDMVTMDIEGAELRAMLGATRLLTEDRPILFISVHPQFMMDRYHDTPDDLYCHLGKLGYSITILGQDHEIHVLAKPPSR